MEIQKVEMFMMMNSKYFPQNKIPFIREKLMNLTDDRFMVVSSIELKDPTTLLIMSVLLGSLGIDRFMLGDTGMGILKLLTGGVCGVLTIIDWFQIQNMTKEYNFQNMITIV